MIYSEYTLNTSTGILRGLSSLVHVTSWTYTYSRHLLIIHVHIDITIYHRDINMDHNIVIDQSSTLEVTLWFIDVNHRWFPRHKVSHLAWSYQTLTTNGMPKESSSVTGKWSKAILISTSCTWELTIYIAPERLKEKISSDLHFIPFLIVTIHTTIGRLD